MYHISLVGVKKNLKLVNSEETVSQTLWRESALTTEGKRNRIMEDIAFVYPQFKREPRT